TQQSGDLKNVRITSAMPDNLETLGQKSDTGDAQRQGNLITLNLASLGAQKGVEIAIRAKIKDGVEVGTRLVSQADATYDGLAAPLQSNVVTVLIVGEQLGPVVQAATPGSTATATSTASPTSGAAATATAAPTRAPTAQPTVTPKPPAPELPATSTGVPLSGFALLGLTLLLRTVRLHREQTRI
ncbi:hypothetical protein SE17_14805, partial [Kouleothrix aurantiaca]